MTTTPTDPAAIDKSLYKRLTPEGIDRVIDRAIYIHNNECRGPDSPVDPGPWSIQKSFHRREDMWKAILSLVKET